MERELERDTLQKVTAFLNECNRQIRNGVKEFCLAGPFDGTHVFTCKDVGKGKMVYIQHIKEESDLASFETQIEPFAVVADNIIYIFALGRRVAAKNGKLKLPDGMEIFDDKFDEICGYIQSTYVPKKWGEIEPGTALKRDCVLNARKKLLSSDFSMQYAPEKDVWIHMSDYIKALCGFLDLQKFLDAKVSKIANKWSKKKGEELEAMRLIKTHEIEIESWEHDLYHALRFRPQAVQVDILGLDHINPVCIYPKEIIDQLFSGELTSSFDYRKITKIKYRNKVIYERQIK